MDEFIDWQETRKKLYGDTVLSQNAIETVNID